MSARRALLFLAFLGAGILFSAASLINAIAGGSVRWGLGLSFVGVALICVAWGIQRGASL
jgi:hypothetical protein